MGKVELLLNAKRFPKSIRILCLFLGLSYNDVRIIANWDFARKEHRHPTIRPIVMSWDKKDDQSVVDEYNHNHLHNEDYGDLNIIHNEDSKILLGSRELAMLLLTMGHKLKDCHELRLRT